MTDTPAKPKSPSKLGAEKPTPQEQLERFHGTVGSPARGDGSKPKPAKLGAEKLTPEEQRRRFEELSRQLKTDNGETLDSAFGKIVPAIK